MARHLTLTRAANRGSRRGGTLTPPRHATRDAVAEALAAPAQTRLKLGAPDDAREREADATAERVMRMPEGAQGATPAESIRRKCAECEKEEQVRRAAAPEDEEDKEEEEAVQRKGGTDAGGPVAADVAARVQARRGGGQPLPAGERAFFEPRFGTDFSRVRIHADAEAAALSHGLSARAFTVGRDLFFGGGEYRPGTAQGRHLMAHELTHTLQQKPEARTIRRASIGLHAQRPGSDTSTGHAFVTLENNEGRRRGWGFYAACTRCNGTMMCSDSQLTWLGISGATDGIVCDDTHHPDDARIRYTLTAAKFADAEAEVASMRSSPPEYDLYSYNCVDFVRTVAEAAGVSVPDFPGIDEPEEMATHIRHEADRRVVRSGSLGLVSEEGDDVPLDGDAPNFHVSGLPSRHGLQFRWMIADADDNRYLMWSSRGSVQQYGRSSTAYIGSGTRQMLMERGIRQATILCRVIAARGTHDAPNVRLELPVRFTW